MRYEKNLTLNCSVAALNAAADIAPEYGLDIISVAELITELEAGELTEELSSAETARRANELRSILTEIMPLLQRLQDITWRELTAKLPFLGVSLLAIAMVSGSDVVRLGHFGHSLHDAAVWAGEMEPRPDEINPRDAVILAKMMRATMFWLDFDEPARFGGFVDTANGRLPEEGGGLEFVVRVMLAANDSLQVSDLYKSFDILEANIDLERTHYYEHARPSHLRLVK